MKTLNILSKYAISAPPTRLPYGLQCLTATRPNRRHRIKANVSVALSCLLSPLSTWTILFVNVPLALAFGWITSRFYRPLFKPAVVVGFALTNFLGLVLNARARTAPGVAAPPRRLSRDIAVAMLSTVLALVFVLLGILDPIEACLTAKEKESRPR